MEVVRVVLEVLTEGMAAVTEVVIQLEVMEAVIQAEVMAAGMEAEVMVVATNEDMAFSNGAETEVTNKPSKLLSQQFLTESEILS
jgi:hypothetical protein